MSLTTPSISNAQLVMSVNPATITPLQEILPVILPMTFSSVANLNIINGSFTPANNSATIATNLSAVSPNFILFMCDRLANLFFDNSMVIQVPVSRIFMTTMTAIAGGGNPINTIQIIGTTSSAYPMAQGVAMNYTLVYGQATVT